MSQCFINLYKNLVMENSKGSNIILFKKMDSQVTRQRYKLSREDGFVLNWSVNSASLEELFFKVVKPNILTLNQCKFVNDAQK
jgi:hypothetical protein